VAGEWVIVLVLVLEDLQAKIRGIGDVDVFVAVEETIRDSPSRVGRLQELGGGCGICGIGFSDVFVELVYIHDKGAS
jgi:hypothetical protein